MTPTVDRDLVCRRCAYNLRGLPHDGRCPECGAPVRVALLGDVLELADPEWLARLGMGARLAGTSGFVFLWIGGLFQVVRHVFQLPDWMDMAFMGTGGLALVAVLARAAWLISTPNKELRTREKWFAPRRCIRFSIISAVTAFLAALLLGVTIGPTWGLGLAIAMEPPFGLLGLTVAIGMARYIRKLADLANDVFTLSRTRVYVRIYLVCWVMFWGSIGVAVLGFMSIACLSLVAGLGVLAFGILLMFLPTYLRNHIETALAEARRHWAEE